MSDIIERWVLEGDTTQAQTAARQFESVVKGTTAAVGQKNQSLQRMGEGIQRVTGLMSGMGAASGNVGRVVSDVTGKLFGLGSALSVGGPVGLALAGATAAIAAGTAAWGLYSAAAEEAKKELEEFGKAVDSVRTTVSKSKDEVDKARAAFMNFGKSQVEVAENAAKALSNQAAAEERTLVQMQARLRELKQDRRVDEDEIHAEEQRIARQKQLVALLREEADARLSSAMFLQMRKEAEDRKAADESAPAVHAKELSGALGRAKDIAAREIKRQKDEEEENERLRQTMTARQNLIYELEQKKQDGLNEIHMHNLELRAKADAEADELARQRTERWVNMTGQAAAVVMNSVANGILMLAESGKFAWKKMVADTLNAFGRMLLAAGIRDVAEGAARVVRSYGGDPTGYELMTQGAAESAAGIAMMSGTLLATRGGGGGGGGGGGSSGNAQLTQQRNSDITGRAFGSGGGTFSGGGAGGEEKAPVQIIVAGALTSEETAVLVNHALQSARAKGLI